MLASSGEVTPSLSGEGHTFAKRPAITPFEATAKFGRMYRRSQDFMIGTMQRALDERRHAAYRLSGISA